MTRLQHLVVLRFLHALECEMLQRRLFVVATVLRHLMTSINQGIAAGQSQSALGALLVKLFGNKLEPWLEPVSQSFGAKVLLRFDPAQDPMDEEALNLTISIEDR